MFNAEIVYTPRGAIPFILAINNTNGILTSLLADKKLKDIDLGGKWNQNVSSRWLIAGRWSTVSLSNLRRVNTSSRAYEAGVDDRLGRANPDIATLKGTTGYNLGQEHANTLTNAQRDEAEAVRKMIMGTQ
jgi:hypothetical protein